MSAELRIPSSNILKMFTGDPSQEWHPTCFKCWASYEGRLGQIEIQIQVYTLNADNNSHERPGSIIDLFKGELGTMKRNQKGFTLIELLVVIAIIGILAAIAIPQFAAYRSRGFDARAKSDLRNVATAEEAYFADSEVYKSCTNATCPGLLPGIEAVSNGVTLGMTAAATSFTGTSTHSKGTGITCNWDSTAGGLTGCS